MTDPVIALVADHAGFELKNSMKVVLDEQSFLSSTLDQRPPIPSTIQTWPASWRARSKTAARSRGCSCAARASALPSRPTATPGSVPPCVTTSRRASGARAQRRQRSCPWRSPDRARCCARLFVDFSEDALCRGPPRAACGQVVVARAAACALNPGGNQACVQRLP
jgi:hypothetical protein